MMFQANMKFKDFQQFISLQRIAKIVHENMKFVGIFLKEFFFKTFFQGGREVDDFIKYLARESTEPLNGYDRNGSKQKGKKTDDGEL